MPTQAQDRAWGTALLTKTQTALDAATADEAEQLKISQEMTAAAQPPTPAASVDTNALIAQEEVYRTAQDLTRNLNSYKGGVEGWIGGIGQPNHETRLQLLVRLGTLYPDAADAVFPEMPSTMNG